MTNFIISFALLSKTTLPITLAWLDKPHVQTYLYGQGLINTQNHLQDFIDGNAKNFEAWIALIDNKPFALLMTSKIKTQDPYKKYCTCNQSETLDVLIGSKSMLGKGLGTKMLKAFIQEQSNVQEWLIDPSATNKRAIKCYEKVGFKSIETFYPDFDPKTLHKLMRLTL